MVDVQEVCKLVILNPDLDLVNKTVSEDIFRPWRWVIISDVSSGLKLSQTTNVRLFQTERVCR